MVFLLTVILRICYNIYMIDFREKELYFSNCLFLEPFTQPYFRKHMHNEYELYLFLEGDVDYIVGESIYHLQKNDFLLIPPTVYHYPRFLSQTPYHRFVVNFTCEHLVEQVRKDLNDYKILYRLPSNNVILKLYDHAFELIEHYNNRADICSALTQYVNLILTELKYLKDTASTEEPKSIHPLLHKTLKFIDNNTHRNFQLKDIANELNVSQSLLTHTFKKHMGISLIQYVQHKKMLLAQQAIQNGMLPTEIAKQLGFENYTTFYLQYKSIINNIPSKSKHSPE